MNQLQLLRDYVTTMERQIESKNCELTTLRKENEKLIMENQQISNKKSYFITSSVCEQCPRTKKQLSELQSLCNTLQLKYDQLEQKCNSSSSVRVFSTNCAQCGRHKRDYEELKIKYEQLQRNQISRVSTTTRVYSAASCSDCPKLRSEVKTKDDIIICLRSDLANQNAKILSLQGQIFTLNATTSKPVVYTQTLTRPNDLQRIVYLNGQIEQYMALVNSLRSQIKILNEQNQRYNYRIRELQSRPRQVQFIEKQFSPEIREQMRGLKIEIGQLSNDNIILRRQNADLKRQIMNLQKTSHIIIERPQSSSPINDERAGRHFRKSMIGRKNFQSNISAEKISYPQKVKYDDLERKIQMLQIENEYLKGTFYSEI